MNQPNARELQLEIYQWADHNFTPMDDVGWGIVEELGEYAHAMLKSKQSIRGYRQQANEAAHFFEKKQEQLKDSLADCMIFTLQLAEKFSTFVSFEEANEFGRENRDASERFAFAWAVRNASVVVQSCETWAAGSDPLRHVFQQLLNSLFRICWIHKWEPVTEVLMPVWNEVKKRDWIKYPITGLAEQETGLF